MGFLSTLSLRRATGGTLQGMVGNAIFLSTLSLRRATFLMERDGVQYYISIHALLAESDQLLVPLFRDVSHFYPRSPCGERPCSSTYRPLGSLISIHALLAESDDTLLILIIGFSGFLSTLSLRRATEKVNNIAYTDSISIHALLAESDFRHCTTYLNCSLFLSTLSLRRATNIRSIRKSTTSNFYPRSPCGERLELLPEWFCNPLISIHALLAESDMMD